MHETKAEEMEKSVAVEVVDEATLDRVAVLTGMTYGDLIRAYFSINREVLGLVLVPVRCEAPDETYEYPDHEPIPVRVHSAELIDEAHYIKSYAPLEEGQRQISLRADVRDGRKGWQTCYGPALRFERRHGSKDWRTWGVGKKH